MSDLQYEEVKKEIRSVLITYQKGCSLSEFKKEYRNLIGRPLPSKEFNFKDDITFLRCMPDAVAVYNSPVPGDYLLIGIADKSIKHIQKMVTKQKASKHKPTFRAPKRSFTQPVSHQRSYVPKFEPLKNVPPRFQKPLKETTIFLKKELPTGVDQCVIRLFQHFHEGLKLSNFLESFRKYYNREFKFKDWGFPSLEECLETIPGLQAVTRNNEIFVYLEENDSPKNNFSESVNNYSKSSASKRSTDHLLTNQSSNGIEISNLNSKSDYFDRDFNKKVFAEKSSTCDLPSQNISKAALKDNFLLNRFVEDVQQKNSSFQTFPKHPFDDHYLSNDFDSSAKSNQKNICFDNKLSKVDALDDFQLIDFRESQTVDSRTSSPQASKDFVDTPKLHSFIQSPCDISSSISEHIRNNLQKVVEKYPHAIFASEFPNSYEKVTGTPFDLHSFGFNHLADFIDAVPDILIRKPLTGSKKDWLIYPVKGPELDPGKGCLLFIECVILNTRKILQAYTEGIKLSEFNHIYSVNCNEPLYIRDLGYDNLEYFLLGIAQRVPLQITSVGADKIVLLEKFEEKIKSLVPTSQLNMAPPHAKFPDLILPPHYVNTTQYFPVYTSSIAHPGFFYIQLQGEEYSDSLKKLYDDIEDFYNGDLSDAYTIKPKDIRAGTVCVALWPSDQHWYRAKIASIVSMEFVTVFYVDYGTTDEIPLNMLRYIRREYLDLPAQAIKSRLKFVKPAKGASHWDKRSRERMLELCQDVPLMAKIEDIKDGVLSLILCDTNGDIDLFINDILRDEGIADYSDELENPEQPSPAEIAQQQLMQLLTTLTVAARSSSENIARLAQNCSLQNVSAFPQTMPSFPLQNPVSPVPRILSPCIPPLTNNLNSLYGGLTPSRMDCVQKQPQPFSVLSSDKELRPTENTFFGTQAAQFYSVPPVRTPSPEAADVFDDDDDASFEQFYRSFSVEKTDGKKRYVKRIKTGDGYIFHVLLHNDKAYVSSGDISILIWSTKEPSHLFRRLQTQSEELLSITLQEDDGLEEFFKQLLLFNVKGIVRNDSTKSSVLVYPLENVNQILNLFGHPSAALRAKVRHEANSFNPLASHWQEFPDNEVPEEIEEIRSVTDDDKLNRLCLYDLKAMREGIRMKRLNLTKAIENLSNVRNSDEISKLDQLYCKVRDRIQEIELICKTFS